MVCGRITDVMMYELISVTNFSENKLLWMCYVIIIKIQCIYFADSHMQAIYGGTGWEKYGGTQVSP